MYHHLQFSRKHFSFAVGMDSETFKVGAAMTYQFAKTTGDAQDCMSFGIDVAFFYVGFSIFLDSHEEDE